MKPDLTHMKAVVVRDPMTPNYSQDFIILHRLRRGDDGVLRWVTPDEGSSAEAHGADEAKYRVYSAVEGWSGPGSFVSLHMKVVTRWGDFEEAKEWARTPDPEWLIPE